jgi:hypothetical protein
VRCLPELRVDDANYQIYEDSAGNGHKEHKATQHGVEHTFARAPDVRMKTTIEHDFAATPSCRLMSLGGGEASDVRFIVSNAMKTMGQQLRGIYQKTEPASIGSDFSTGSRAGGQQSSKMSSGHGRECSSVRYRSVDVL